jgi:hypothetical protein
MAEDHIPEEITTEHRTCSRLCIPKEFLMKTTILGHLRVQEEGRGEATEDQKWKILTAGEEEGACRRLQPEWDILTGIIHRTLMTTLHHIHMTWATTMEGRQWAEATIRAAVTITDHHHQKTTILHLCTQGIRHHLMKETTTMTTVEVKEWVIILITADQLDQGILGMSFPAQGTSHVVTKILAAESKFIDVELIRNL